MVKQRGHGRVAALAVAATILAAVVPSSAGAGPSLAPGFTLDGLNGPPVSFAAHNDSPAILLFWAPW